ncbi:MAG: anti-sigma factor family protein, partial [Blastocatellia bacterium]
MANERNNTALEFETMLRRHLKSGGAPVAACAGFDFDAASAYLENEIVAARRVGYESHLAGCATCRRHLIELSRLAQTAPHAGTQPVRVADRTPAWVRWREVVVGWFDLPAWNLKWQMVGAAGAAFAILIAALGVQSWRQASKPAGIVASAPIPPATSVDSNPQAPAPEASPDGTPFLIAGNSVADRQGQSRPSVPLPLVGPKDGEREVAAAPAPDSLSLPSSQPSEPFSFDFGSRRDASGDAQQGKDAVRQNQISPQKSPTPLPNNLHNLSRPDLAISRARAQDATDSASRSSGNELATRITPPSKINPMNSGLPELEPRLRTLTSHDGQTAPANPGPPEPGSRIKPQPEKSSSRLKLKTLSEIRRSFLPGSKS